MNRPSDPRGVCVSGQYVYVSNVGGHNLSVFTTAGHYVVSFCQNSREVGDFRHGICMDM